MAADSAVSASAKGATFLILLQIGSRALTFALNQVLLRFLSPSLLGAAVQLELFVISAHHFARESLRVACQRQPEGGIQAIINLSYLAIASGIPIVLILAQGYLMTDYPDVPYFVEALRISEVAAIIELFSEPAFVAVQQNMLYKTRAAAEASAVIVKTVSTVSFVLWARSQSIEVGALPFAVGEVAYCSTLTFVYLWQTGIVAAQQGFSLFLRKIKSRCVSSSLSSKVDHLSNFHLSPGNVYYFALFSQSLINLSFSLYIQSGIKYLLTSGDTIVSTTLASLEDQGKYALSSNYGGLVARMIFRPIEDSSRNLFAKLCGQTESTPPSKSSDLQTKPDSNTSQAADALYTLLRVYATFSLLVFAIGPVAAPLLLRLVAGARWSDSGAGEVLGMYAYCIPLLALNGVSEAFVAATASTRELHRQSVWMGAFSVGFAASAYVFLRVLELGAKGLVLANCVNMALRIWFNLGYAKRFFRERGQSFSLFDLLPNLYAVSATAVVPSLIVQTKGFLARYGLLGELVHVGGFGLTFALFV